MNDKDRTKILGIFLILAIVFTLTNSISWELPSILSSFNESLSDDDLHFDKMEAYILPYLTVNTTSNDTDVEILHIVNSSNYEKFPQQLYYRNGTIAGWLINGTFTTKFTYDIWISFCCNTTTNFKINSWEEVE